LLHCLTYIFCFCLRQLFGLSDELREISGRPANFVARTANEVGVPGVDWPIWGSVSSAIGEQG
jgi:hypothetical protein